MVSFHKVNMPVSSSEEASSAFSACYRRMDCKLYFTAFPWLIGDFAEWGKCEGIGTTPVKTTDLIFYLPGDLGAMASQEEMHLGTIGLSFLQP